MVITQDRPSPKSTGVKSEVGFTIDPRNLAHVVGLLRDAYSDPIAAVLREYSVNAYDAHVEAGIPDKQVHITLPGRFDPTLKIRDFGHGLSEDQIEGLFCSYGASSKRESNDYTGCLGIGCKSAFAITDSFSVTTYHGGRARTYSCYLDESEVGKAALLSDVASKETGLLISIPIKKDQMSEVESTAVKVFRFFKVQPHIENPSTKTTIELTRPQYDYDGGDIKIAKESGDSMVIMGNIGYPLEASQLPSDNLRQIIDHHTIHLHMPIGAVDIAPSREDLKYNPRTKAALVAALSKGFVEVGQKAVMDIAGSTNLLNALSVYEVVFNAYHLGPYIRKLGLTPKYKGKELKSSSLSVSLSEEEIAKHRVTVRKLSKLRYNRRGRNYELTATDSINVRSGTVVYLDTKSSVHDFFGRVRTLLETPGFEVAYVVKARGNGLDFLRKKHPLLQEIQFTPIEDVAFTEAPKTTVNGVSAGPIAKHDEEVFTLDTAMIGRYSNKQSDYWKSAKVNLSNPNGGVYLEIDRFLINGVTSPRNFEDTYNSFCKLGFDEKVYGFKPSVVEEIKKGNHPQWVSLHDKRIELLNAKIAKDPDAFWNHYFFVQHKTDQEDHVESFMSEELVLPAGSVAAQYQQALRDCSKHTDLMNRCRYEVENHAASMALNIKPKIDCNLLQQAYNARYPMNLHWDWDNDSFLKDNTTTKAKRQRNFKHLSDYIRLVDECKPIKTTINQKEVK